MMSETTLCLKPYGITFSSEKKYHTDHTDIYKIYSFFFKCMDMKH